MKTHLHSLRACVAAVAIAALSGCGGGGGSDRVISTPNPAPAPTPTPTPTPTPAPSTNFNTREFRQSDGPEFHGAVTAWEDGNTGEGSIIAVVDTGIDQDSPEFAGRLHPSSQDVASSRGVDAEDDHGTNVALVAAAARDGNGILGIAFDAQVLALRADTPGSCTTDTPEDSSLGCTFFDRDIARGIDVAIDAGATVVNLSLGGEGASRGVLDAVRRASSAGVVVVVAAGNFGDGSDPDFDRFQPTPFAAQLRQAGGDNVIIVGSVDESGELSSFSNRAGDEADYFLTARGERVCCVYENGAIFVETNANGSFTYLFSGTSFAAPQVAGAVALIKQAFPNMTGAEIVELLLESARDAGDSGTDTSYGRGILDIAQAFRPAGTMRLAGTDIAVRIGGPTAMGSAAMGDALNRSGPITTIGLDKYDRAYGVNLANGFRSAEVRDTRLQAALMPGGRRVAAENRSVSMAFTVRDPSLSHATYGVAGQLQLTEQEAQQAAVLAGRVVARLSPDLAIAMAVREDHGSLSAQLRGAEKPAFLIARSGSTGLGGATTGQRTVAASWTMAGGRASVSSATGRVAFGSARTVSARFGPESELYRYRSFAFDYDRNFGGFGLSAGLEWLAEDETLLGGWFGGTLGGAGADTIFLRGAADYSFAPRWLAGSSFVFGRSSPEAAGVIQQGSTLHSTAWSFDLERESVFTSSDRIGFRVAQPLRVERGGLSLQLPVGFDYSTERPVIGRHMLDLTPSGREMVGEMRWSGPLGAGFGGASMYYRRNPGHSASAKDDAGVAVNWSMQF